MSDQDFLRNDPFANPAWSAGKAGVQCCFCAEGIEPRGADPVSVIIPAADRGNQELWAHVRCLRAAVHPSTPLAVFDDDGDEGGRGE
jgi:hypothetical protein